MERVCPPSPYRGANRARSIPTTFYRPISKMRKTCHNSMSFGTSKPTLESCPKELPSIAAKPRLHQARRQCMALGEWGPIHGGHGGLGMILGWPAQSSFTASPHLRASIIIRGDDDKSPLVPMPLRAGHVRDHLQGTRQGTKTQPRLLRALARATGNNGPTPQSSALQNRFPHQQEYAVGPSSRASMTELRNQFSNAHVRLAPSAGHPSWCT